MFTVSSTLIWAVFTGPADKLCWLSDCHSHAMRRGSCLELYYCNMVEWPWWDSGLIWKTNWFRSVLWHCWFGHMTCKIVPEMTYNVPSGTLSLYTTVSSQTVKSRLDNFWMPQDVKYDYTVNLAGTVDRFEYDIENYLKVVVVFLEWYRHKGSSEPASVNITDLTWQVLQHHHVHSRQLYP